MATMEAAPILSTPQPPWLHITSTSILLSNTRNPNLHFQNPKFPHLKTRNFRVHAEAKGFNSLQKKNVAGKTPAGKKKSDDDEDEKIPQIVWDRMTIRILGYVGVPLVTGVALLQIISVLKEGNLVDVPKWVAFVTSLLSFGASALGIAYGTLSTSWDAEREGSILGFEQVQKNWVDMWNEEDDKDEEDIS